jgi:signal transduction histidine kinase
LKLQNKELDEFAQTVAHDLKTPLTAILGFAEVLEIQYDDLDPETITHSLQMVASSAKKALRIVDELLLLARVSQVQGGNISTQPLDMAAIVEEAHHRLQNLLHEYDATLQIPDSWPVAVGHPGWVEEVWVNYISNAIKYGGKAPYITIGSRVIKQSNGDFVLFAVKDWGPGLSKDAQSQLFTPFTRLGQSRTKSYGLGLSIVQRIITKLGGEVGVESKGIPGQGSVFYFTLPQYNK